MINKEIEIKYLLRDFNRSDFSFNFFKINFGSLEKMIKRVQREGDYYTQYYLADERAKDIAKEHGLENYNDYNVLRIRNIKKNNTGKIERILTLKGPSAHDLENLEEEYPITEKAYGEYVSEALYKLTKRRLTLAHPQDSKFNIEFDVFCDNNYLLLNNLFSAEVEGKSELELRVLPFIGIDVSKEKEYKNFSLAKLNGLLK